MDKVVPSSSTTAGNTKAVVKQIPPSKQWCFTWNNYTDDVIDPFLDILKSKCEMYIFQEEVGENETRHLQGSLIFLKKERPKAIFIGLTDKIHWEKTKDLRASIKYCCKEDTRNGKIWANFPIPKKIKTIEPSQFYKWQNELLDVLNSEPNERSIYWYIDSLGSAGKTCFCKWLVVNKNALVLCGKSSDMKNGILMFEKNKGFYPEIIIIDLPRTFEMEYLSYTGIEEIKNGLFYSPKYEGGMCVFNCPHVIIMSNEEPEQKKLSKDRWILKHI